MLSTVVFRDVRTTTVILVGFSVPTSFIINLVVIRH